MFEFDVLADSAFAEPEEFQAARPVTVHLDLAREVGTLVRQEAVVLAPDATVAEAALHLARVRASAALVAVSGLLVGVIDERTLLRALATGETCTVAELADRSVPVLCETDSLAYALAKSRTQDTRHYPLVAADGDTLVGLLELDDLLTELVGQVATTGQRPRD